MFSQAEEKELTELIALYEQQFGYDSGWSVALTIAYSLGWKKKRWHYSENPTAVVLNEGHHSQNIKKHLLVKKNTTLFD